MWRFIMAGKFGGLLVLFLFPWIDVRCETKLEGETAAITVARQSGIQIARGRFSKVNPAEDIADELGGGADLGDPAADNPMLQKLSDPPTAAPIVVYAFVVLVGLVVCLVVPGKTAIIGAGICAVLAVAILAFQILVGFPIAKEIQKNKPELLKIAQKEWAGDDDGPPPIKGDGIDLRVRYRPAFYLVCLTTLALPAGIWFSFVEEKEAARRRKKRKRRPRPRNDGDEEP